MKKKLFILISILTLIVLLGMAAICNMCGLNPSAETDGETSSKNNDEENIIEAGNSSSTQTGSSSSTETGNSESTETSISGSEDSKTVPPSIKLQIYEGPTYSQTDDVCYYRVEAIVSGNPVPSVTFSKDDSNGSFGSKKVQVNLTKSSPNYTLTAKAINSEGEATAKIDLTWGCGPTNNPPKIDKLSLISMGGVIINTMYDVTAYADDPDGDILTYEWSANGGSLKNAGSNPVKWGTPGTPGTYNIGVTVSDGKGGQDFKSMNIEVKQPQISNLNLNHVPGEEGAVTDWPSISKSNIMAGDHVANESYRGFLSFDITALAGATIQDAKLTFGFNSIFGDLSNFGEFLIETVDHGADSLVFQDYNLNGILIQSFSSVNNGYITCTASNLKTQLQNAVNSGKTSFQLRIRFSVPTDNDKVMDLLQYQAQNIAFNTTFSK